jgi:hypothetical protein
MDRQFKGSGVQDSAAAYRADGDGRPRCEYERRLQSRRLAAAREVTRQRITGNARVGVVLLALAMCYPILISGQLSVPWLLVPVVLFVGVSILHDRVTRSWLRAQRAVEFYEQGLARLDQHWMGKGQAGTRFLTRSHPYGLDLDLFGIGSIFELLCTARTTTGEETLAAWLQAAASVPEVCARQQAVAELQPRIDLREEIGLLGAGVPAGIDLEGLARWGETPRVLPTALVRLVALLLALLAVAALVAWADLGTGPSPLLVIVFLEAIFALWLRTRVQSVLAPIERRGHDLLLLSGLLARLEQEPFAAPRLRHLREALVIAGEPPSRRLAHLANLLDWFDSRHNPLFAPIAALLLVSVQLAYALENWRASTGPAIRGWLAVVGEFEALCALATYGYENPADPFPEVVPEGPCFQGEALGHPLLPRRGCIRNDVNLGGALRLLVVSGSNMSGKSTLLRTVGVNAVLALAGAPVRATRLRISPLAIGATLRLQDSLQEGKSRFYAEITRIRQLVDLTRGPLPLLFLLDELLHGTNSHDRRLGAEAVVRGLIDAGAIGLITTHDLALTHIAEHLGPRAANVHFEDNLKDAAMTFDYRMREGVVRKSNALELMRAVGLDV